MEALRRSGRAQSRAGQRTENDCSVRTVARSGKCHVVGSREKWRREGGGEEAECLTLCSSHTELRGEIFQKFLTVLVCWSTARSDSHTTLTLHIFKLLYAAFEMSSRLF